MVQITLPDGSQREFPAPVTVAVRERFVNDFMECCFDGLNDCLENLNASSADSDGARAALFNRVRYFAENQRGLFGGVELHSLNENLGCKLATNPP